MICRGVEQEVNSHVNGDVCSINHKPYRIISKFGEIKWVNDVTLLRRDNNNEVTHFEGVIIDITEQKESEQALKDNYLSVIENMVDGFYKSDVSGNAIFISPSVSEMLNFSKNEIIGKPIASFYAYPQERRVFLKEILKTGEVNNHRVEFIRKEKSNIFMKQMRELYTKMENTMV